jgi:3'(2'), 5'-bisphosphate nucleotidase
VADICAEVVINSKIRDAFPDDCIIGEEDETECSEALFQSVNQHISSLKSKQELESILQSPQPTSESSRYWAVDPIDGTKGFIRGDQYAVCIALVNGADQETALAALGCPNLMDGIVLLVIRGFGIFKTKLGEAFDELQKLTAPQICASLRTAQFTGAFESSHTKTTELADLMKSCDNTLPLLKMDSQCKYALLALGTAQIYYRRHASKKGAVLNSAEYVEAIWDNAPGVLFVEEAGGLVTDFAGNRFTFPPAKHFKVVGGIVASTLTPELHFELVHVIRGILQ